MSAKPFRRLRGQMTPERRERNRKAAECELEELPRMTVADAIAEADALDLPDGAWWSYVEELSGRDAGDIAEWLEKHSEEVER